MRSLKCFRLAEASFNNNLLLLLLLLLLLFNECNSNYSKLRN